jgi:hypothetical protein
MAGKNFYYTKIDRVTAAERIINARQWNEQAAYFYAKELMKLGQGAELALRLAQEAGNAKVESIARTVIDTIKEGANGGSYRRVSPAQMHTLACAVLETYSTPEEIGHAIWGLTADELTAAERGN